MNALFQFKLNVVFWLLFALLVSCYSLDHAAYVDDFLVTASERSFVIFAIARGINGVISVIQSAEVGFSFAVSATLAPGEILDPINDLIERFSLVMLTASAALWIFRILSDFILSPILLWLAMGLLILGQLMTQQQNKPGQFLGLLFSRLSAAAVILVTVFIGMAVATEAIHQSSLVQAEYQRSHQQLDENLLDLQQMNAELLGEPAPNTCEGMRDCAQYYAEKASQYAESISRSVITQIAIFVLETLLMPLFCIWLAARLITIYVIRRRPITNEG